MLYVLTQSLELFKACITDDGPQNCRNDAWDAEDECDERNCITRGKSYCS